MQSLFSLISTGTEMMKVTEAKMSLVGMARARPDLRLVLVGPVSLPGDVVAELEKEPAIHLLGPRPYDQVPAYLQHADVVVIPHLVNPFTESAVLVAQFLIRCASSSTTRSGPHCRTISRSRSNCS